MLKAVTLGGLDMIPSGRLHLEIFQASPTVRSSQPDPGLPGLAVFTIWPHDLPDGLENITGEKDVLPAIQKAPISGIQSMHR